MDSSAFILDPKILNEFVRNLLIEDFFNRKRYDNAVLATKESPDLV